jgi:glutamine synthetase
MSTILEYVWLDGYKTANLRSKIKVGNFQLGFAATETNFPVEHCPVWNFDGSSTQQAPGSASECLLQPVRTYCYDKNHFIVLCEVNNVDGTSHTSNFRANLRELHKDCEEEFWWGFEQEYFIMEEQNRILGWVDNAHPAPQGPYYCGVGSFNTVGRELVEKHMYKCLEMGIELTGINAEVALGQWEFQCFSKDTLKACDDLWISRYVLSKLAEKSGYDINLHPKPVSGDWNGSGCHTNFSTNWMRKGIRGEQGIIDLMTTFKENKNEHISVYGLENEQRLTGDHETQSINKFSYGVGDRGASIRIPHTMVANNWAGYIEDRRPASNCDPYKVSAVIINSTKK